METIVKFEKNLKEGSNVEDTKIYDFWTHAVRD